MSKENNKRRLRGPEHIGSILNDYRKEMLRKKAERMITLPEFSEIKKEAPFIQVVFLYINGDPEYIRTIFLN